MDSRPSRDWWRGDVFEALADFCDAFLNGTLEVQTPFKEPKALVERPRTSLRSCHHLTNGLGLVWWKRRGHLKTSFSSSEALKRPFRGFSGGVQVVWKTFRSSMASQQVLLELYSPYRPQHRTHLVAP